jgi:Mce-associated membrane protein
MPGDTDELALAEARAEAARARATRLRELADAASGTAGEAPRTLSARWRPHRPSRRALAVTAAIVAICAAFAASGALVWHHREVVQQRRNAAEFAAAARNAVQTMMSMDPDKARDQMQRFADDSTGMFKAGILMGAEDAIKSLQQSNVSSKGTVAADAVESATEDSALVLVVAKTEFSQPGRAKPGTRSLRLVVTVQREGGQPKIARVEFVP